MLRIQKHYIKMNAYITHKYGHSNFFLIIRHGIGIVVNHILFEATISDYFELSFYNKHIKDKKAYITSPDALRFAAFVDSMQSIIKYNSKTEMYLALRERISRDQLYSVSCSFDEFAAFALKHPVCFYKPDTADCGHGIEKWFLSDSTLQEKYLRFVGSAAVLDEPVLQCAHMSALHESSVNTVRLYSIIINGQCEIFASFLRVGRNGMIVDNLGSGGLLAGIDLNSGIVITPATDDTGRHFEKHPNTRIAFKGFQIPRWPELLSFVEKAAKDYPLKYVGWDIVVCDDGFKIVEVNPNPMIHGIQTVFFGGRKAQYDSFRSRIKATR